MWISVVCRVLADTPRRQSHAFWTLWIALRRFRNVSWLRVVTASRLMPPVVVHQGHLPAHSAIPAKLEAALARDVIALVPRLEATTELASAWTWFPTHLQGFAPSFLLVYIGLVLLPCVLQLLPAAFARHVRMRSIIALAAEAMTLRATQIVESISRVDEHALLATSRSAIEDARIIPGQELEQFLVSTVWKARLEDIDVLLGT
mmetsp:Transcript_107009/g.301047  ORF Transcript_107009/g.301047 Transcript_107009/m.301047 type:complete len:204 (+) Transcript_107009:311-922(+)